MQKSNRDFQDQFCYLRFSFETQQPSNQKTIEYFEKNQPVNLYPTHFTEMPALAAFYAVK